MITSDISALRAEFPVWISVPVQWGDQDAFGHVNNTIYLRWIESSRIAYGNFVGLAQTGAGQRIGPILARLSCNYRRQVKFPDTVHVGARITRIGNSSMTMEHCIISDALGAVAADGDSTLVAFDYLSNKSVPLPEAMRQAIGKIEGKDFSASVFARPGNLP